MSERSYNLFTKIIRAVPKRSECELLDVVGENVMRMSQGNVSEFQKKKNNSGALPTVFPTIDEKDGKHQRMTEMEPLLDVSGHRT